MPFVAPTLKPVMGRDDSIAKLKVLVGCGVGPQSAGVGDTGVHGFTIPIVTMAVGKKHAPLIRKIHSFSQFEIKCWEPKRPMTNTGLSALAKEWKSILYRVAGKRDSPQSTGLFVSLQRPVQKGTGVVAKASGPACLGSASIAHRNRPGQTVGHRKTIFTSPSRLPRPPDSRRFPQATGSRCPNRGIFGGGGVLYRVQLTEIKINLSPKPSTPNNIHVFVDFLGPPLPSRIRDADSGVKHGTRLVRCTV